MRNSRNITVKISDIAGSSVHVVDLAEILMRSGEHLNNILRSPWK
jgi:hypothetical protein